ncbi:MAG: DUF2809 domain-containing protein [Bacteroidia bacterium]|nr:DUF2809 domain-containing protein [Bacteroidia bacterium]
MNRNRNRLLYLLMVTIVICLGLLSRRISDHLPDLINLVLGDILWALMVYLLIRTVFRSWSIRKVALTGLTFSFLIELSQIYHAPWIDAIRNTTLGGLILGFGFLWSDLVAYSIGIGFGIVIDYYVEAYLMRKNGA